MPISHSRYSDATKLRSEKARRATEGNRFWLSGADQVLEETVTRHTSCSKSSRHWPFIYTPHSELRTSSIKNLEPSNREFHKNISRLTSQE
jgi:hypothetical protein